ncbi:hypothetical protein [Rubritalea tangerina]|uniref:hypothetical protein n=1 Tax=Rubritalea tangerina TaxID=430798 RepID=UPI003620F3E9
MTIIISRRVKPPRRRGCLWVGAHFIGEFVKLFSRLCQTVGLGIAESHGEQSGIEDLQKLDRQFI